MSRALAIDASGSLVLAIDPGPVESAYVLWDGREIHEHGKGPNAAVLLYIRGLASLCGLDALVIEKIASYGMAVGQSVFETVFWSGRFAQAFGGKVYRITRKETVLHICNSPRANDASVRAALIDRFGGKDKAIGTKKAPGPMYGLSNDERAALAVALTFHDRMSKGWPEGIEEVA